MVHRCIAPRFITAFNSPSLLIRQASSFLAVDEARTTCHGRRVWAARAPRTAVMNVASTSVDPKRIDGKELALKIRKEVAIETARLTEKYGQKPGLAVVIVGERKDSLTYVRSKRKACEEVGFDSFGFELPESVGQNELVKVIDELNERNDVHGILVQLPLPSHIDDEAVLDRVKLSKDVDGFHPLNIGRLCMSGRTPPLFIPCTPKGCIEMIDRVGVSIEGKNAVVIGRSNIVGLPVAMLLLHRNATVTICHSRTKDIEAKVKDADIVIAACGIPEFVKGAWIKKGAVVIDVGINAVDDASKKKGYRLVGDVEFHKVKEQARFVSPVPGGVGPMTIAMLLTNTLEAAKQAFAESV
eukprot:Plantae.Rhodophyta-Hildenbrandia_rubra.ctg14922.p1 GENE.Plantae.Rhodophyta-Hildenbrandia_rubra.ctg14922~~Plantae.Rhodophyta-Hildenbrandia_rubra.ctg14922.p1  ORF type:complete len:356 (-),score=53.66 Plantae.Rhodophyta-Hildenbrandia_rubra.ctg14922:385-1452(-)